MERFPPHVKAAPATLCATKIPEFIPDEVFDIIVFPVTETVPLLAI